MNGARVTFDALPVTHTFNGTNVLDIKADTLAKLKERIRQEIEQMICVYADTQGQHPPVGLCFYSAEVNCLYTVTQVTFAWMRKFTIHLLQEGDAAKRK